MKKYCFAIASILFIILGLSSCSNEENKTLNEAASRPRVPILSNEVRIGTQVWMSKNLNVSKYRNGDVIPQVTDPTQWANLTTGAWCYNSNNTANGIVYGKLYNWYAVDDPRGLAPVGYHIPTDDEWTTLTTFLGGGSVAGGKMKATILWINPNTEATNDTGFTGLPAGYRGDNASFGNNANISLWWSSTQSETLSGWYRSLLYNSRGVARNPTYKHYGFSVRCLKD